MKQLDVAWRRPLFPLADHHTRLLWIYRKSSPSFWRIQRQRVPTQGLQILDLEIRPLMKEAVADDVELTCFRLCRSTSRLLGHIGTLHPQRRDVKQRICPNCGAAVPVYPMWEPIPRTSKRQLPRMGLANHHQ